MSIDQIQQDLKQAQLARDGIKVSTLRLLLSEVINAEIVLRQNSGQANLSDDQLIPIIRREVKKRKEASLAFRSGGREESAQKEEAEAKILEGYLPKQLTTEELTNIVEESINEVGASGIQDMGKVMGVVMDKAAGRADGSIISQLVKERLSS